MSGPRDYDKVKRDLAAAGYRGEPIVVMMGAIGFLPPNSHVDADQLRKVGMNVDLQTMNTPTLFRGRSNKASPSAGGWNAYFIINDCLFNDSPALESLRQDWLDAPDLDAEKRIVVQL